MPAERARRAGERGVDVRLPRVGVGRHEEPRAARAHLVHVVHDLRVPTLVDVAHGEPRFLLREHVPVAVVVVAGVGVVEQRRRGSLVARAELLRVPLAHQVRAVGVVRGDHEQHRLGQHRAHARLVARGQAVEQAQRRERSAHLRRVDRVGHRHDRLAVRDQPLGLPIVEPARVGEARVPEPDLLEPRPVRLGGDGGDHEGAALGGLADLLDAHALGRGVERRQVRQHLAPGRELAVLARDEAEHRLGSRDGRRRGRPGRERGDRRRRRQAPEPEAARQPARPEHGTHTLLRTPIMTG